jgi:hypothetical protein
MVKMFWRLYPRAARAGRAHSGWESLCRASRLPTWLAQNDRPCDLIVPSLAIAVENRPKVSDSKKEAADHLPDGFSHQHPPQTGYGALPLIDNANPH